MMGSLVVPSFSPTTNDTAVGIIGQTSLPIWFNYTVNKITRGFLKDLILQETSNSSKSDRFLSDCLTVCKVGKKTNSSLPPLYLRISERQLRFLLGICPRGNKQLTWAPTTSHLTCKDLRTPTDLSISRN